MLKVGAIAPDFELEDASGTPVSLDRLLARGNLILYFYPADFTPVCTKEACSFRDSHEDLSTVNIQIVGISPQDRESHRKFIEKHALPFPLLCDESRKVIRAYGVNGPLGFGVRRATFLIDRDKRVLKRVVSDFFVGSHARFVKQILEGAGP